MAHLRHFKRPLSGAPAAAASGCRTFFRSASVAGLVDGAFDPDNGKNHYSPQAIAWSAIHA